MQLGLNNFNGLNLFVSKQQQQSKKNKRNLDFFYLGYHVQLKKKRGVDGFLVLLGYTNTMWVLKGRKKEKPYG